MSHPSSEDITVLLNVWAGDNPHSLQRSLQSVFNQVGVRVSLLIVTDGLLTNELNQVISEFENLSNSHFSLKVITNQTQQGLWHVRNVGLEASDSELIALHDADDVMHPRRLITQLRYHQKHYCDVLGSSIVEFDSMSEKILGARAAETDIEAIRDKLRRVNPIAHSSVMLRRQSVLDVGGYRNVHLAEDYDLWIRMATAHFELHNTKESLLAFCRDANFFSRRGGLRFLESELYLWRLKRSSKLSPPFLGILTFIFRCLYRVGPSFLRKAVHTRGLNTVPLTIGITELKDFLLTEKSR
jgi:amylovoran biosynthesis glycosyltransferase AmsE